MASSIALLHPFSGISGDMTLGALVALGLDPEWLRGLAGALGIEGITTEIREVKRAGVIRIPWAGPAARVRVVAWDAAGNSSGPVVRVRRG